MNGSKPGGIPLLRADLSNLTGLTSVTVSDTQPNASTSGTLWFNSANGGLYVYYKDNSGSHWLQANTPAFGSGSGGGSTYTLPTATTSVLGGVKVDGSTLAFNIYGQLYATGAGYAGYSLPQASTSILGGVKVDGTTITINQTTGVISGANTYTLPTASSSVLGGVKVGTGLSISSGVLSATQYTLPTAGVGNVGPLGGVKVDGSTITINNGIISASSSGLSYGVRTSVSATTSILLSNASTTSTVTTGKGYVLYSIQVSAGAWVVVYSSSDSQTSDSSRSITTDPTPGSGVIAESISTTATTTYFSPAVYGYNNDSSVTDNTYLKIYNNSGASNTITVTLTYLRIE
jgi:hypothetical protein